MPASQKRIEANRRNAKKSTGPRTKEGKQRSSQNAKAPTLDSLLPPVEKHSKEFMALLIQFRIDLRPQGMTQEAAVERIALLYWKLRRLQHGEYDLTHAIVTAQARANRLQAILDDDEDYIDLLGEHDRKVHEASKNDAPRQMSPLSCYFSAIACGSKEFIWSQKYELQLQRSFNQSLREYQRLRKFAREEGLERDVDPQEQFIDEGEKLIELKETQLRTEYDDAATSVTVEETIKNEANEEDVVASSVGAAVPSRSSSIEAEERLGTAVPAEVSENRVDPDEASENEANQATAERAPGTLSHVRVGEGRVRVLVSSEADLNERKNPHPDPLPAYRERGKLRATPSVASHDHSVNQSVNQSMKNEANASDQRNASTPAPSCGRRRNG